MERSATTCLPKRKRKSASKTVESQVLIAGCLMEHIRKIFELQLDVINYWQDGNDFWIEFVLIDDRTGLFCLSPNKISLNMEVHGVERTRSAGLAEVDTAVKWLYAIKDV